MKDMLQIMLLCLMLAIMVMFANPRAAQAEENNDVLKSCLKLHEYSPEKFDTFNWGKASRCYHAHAIAQEESKREEIREFLKEKPWYKGANWKWEDKAEYTCTKLYHRNGIVICHKPIYIN